MIDQPVTLLKDWDSKTQELVLRTHLGGFGEVFIARPEKQPTKEVIAADPVRKQAQEETPLHLPFQQSPKTTLDDERVAGIEKKVDKLRLARKIAEEMNAAHRQTGA